MPGGQVLWGGMRGKGSSWSLGTGEISVALQEWVGFRWWEGKRKATPCTEKVTYWTQSSQWRGNREDWKFRARPAGGKSLNDRLRSLDSTLLSRGCKLLADVLIGWHHAGLRCLVWGWVHALPWLLSVAVLCCLSPPFPGRSSFVTRIWC